MRFRLSLYVAGCEHLFKGADGGTKNQTSVGVLAKLFRHKRKKKKKSDAKSTEEIVFDFVNFSTRIM